MSEITLTSNQIIFSENNNSRTQKINVNDKQIIKLSSFKIMTSNNEENIISFSNTKNTIKERIETLIEISNCNEIKNKLKEYFKEMNKLLQVYNNGSNYDKFKENNFSLYSAIQTQLAKIVDLKYDIIDNIIQTDNKKIILNKINNIIEEHKNIIEDINAKILPDINI